uniref:Uncharacterized protein n=1 Tax=viral metagenome TaxID=1070528 RepID=A0A6M3L9W4_9ZZZZ
MFGKAKKIKDLEKLVEYYKGMVEGLERRTTQLGAQNDKLMDRFMATDFQTLQTFTLPERSELIPEYDPTTDDELAGEVLSG